MTLAAKLKSSKRTVAAALAVVGLAAGLAYALLQSHSIITGNTISTASANLLISADGIHYGQTVSGFSFDGIIPGGYPAPMDGYPVYLKNAGNTALDLSLTVDGTPANPGSADLGKINFGLTDVSGLTAPRGFILSSLLGGSQPIEGVLKPGAVRQYKLQALAADDAETGKTIGDIDLDFVGTARDPNDPDQQVDAL